MDPHLRPSREENIGIPACLVGMVFFEFITHLSL